MIQLWNEIPSFAGEAPSFLVELNLDFSPFSPKIHSLFRSHFQVEDDRTVSPLWLSPCCGAVPTSTWSQRPSAAGCSWRAAMGWKRQVPDFGLRGVVWTWKNIGHRNERFRSNPFEILEIGWRDNLWSFCEIFGVKYMVSWKHRCGAGTAQRQNSPSPMWQRGRGCPSGYESIVEQCSSRKYLGWSIDVVKTNIYRFFFLNIHH